MFVVAKTNGVVKGMVLNLRDERIFFENRQRDHRQGAKSNHKWHSCNKILVSSSILEYKGVKGGPLSQVASV